MKNSGVRSVESLLPYCAGKVAYHSRPAAERARDLICRRRLKGAGRLNTYRCTHCHQWHIGRTDRVK